MATFAFTAGTVLINAVDLSDHVRKVTLNLKSDELDSTALGATAHARQAGLNDGTLTLEFNQDFAASKVDATIFPLLGTVTTFEVRSQAGARSTTNPGYTGSVLVADYSPVDASVGDLGTTSVTWNTSGAVARQTS